MALLARNTQCVRISERAPMRPRVAVAPAPMPATRLARAVAVASTLRSSDLQLLGTSDLRELCSKVGVEVGRTPTKDSIISGLVSKGVSVDACSRGVLAELCTKLGVSGGRDAASMKAALASKLGGGYGSSASGSNSWDQWTRSPAPSSNGYSAPAAPVSVSGMNGAISQLAIDDVRDLCRKVGVEVGRTATKDSLVSALVAKGVSIEHFSRGMLATLCAKMGVSGGSTVDSMKAALSSKLGGGYSAPTGASTAAARSFSWSGPAASSPSASVSVSGMSSAISQLAIDDLRDLCKKVGVEVGRTATKDSLVSGLVAKGVSLNHFSRGMLATLCAKMGVSGGSTVDSMKAALSSKLGGGYSAPSAAPSSSNSWDQWSRPASSSSSNGYSSGGDAVYESDLAAFKIDELVTLARKKGIDTSRATKDSLVRSLASASLTLNDLTKGELVEILTRVGQPITGSIDELKARARSAASARQSTRAAAMAGSRW